MLGRGCEVPFEVRPARLRAGYPDEVTVVEGNNGFPPPPSSFPARNGSGALLGKEAARQTKPLFDSGTTDSLAAFEPELTMSCL